MFKYNCRRYKYFPINNQFTEFELLKNMSNFSGKCTIVQVISIIYKIVTESEHVILPKDHGDFLHGKQNPL